MSTVKGWPAQRKHCTRATQEHATVEPVRLQQDALSVLAHQFCKVVAEGVVVEANADLINDQQLYIIKVTGHVAQRGDIVSFTSGALDCHEVKVDSVTTDTIIISENLTEAPAPGDTFKLKRHIYPCVTEDGMLTATIDGVVETKLCGTPINEFGEVTVLAMATTTIISYTVPVGKTLSLDFSEFTGETIAIYRVKIDGATEARENVHWGGGLSGEFPFNGLILTAGQVVLLEVENFRSEACDFSGRIAGRLKDA